MEEQSEDRVPREIDERLRALFHYGQAGRCISSVTHDVNNFLGAMTAYADLIEMDSNLGNDGARMLNEIVEGARRCSSLLSVLVTVTRLEREDYCILDPVTLTESVLDLRRHYIKMHSVTLETHYPEFAPSISANQPRLAAGLLALIMNALEALEGLDHSVMRVTIETSPEYVNFRIWNSGPTISAPDLERHLTPYVSTREGCHIGLGLDLARDAALFHGGSLTYDPESGFCLTISKFGTQIANTDSGHHA